MNGGCEAFRAELERALVGAGALPRLRAHEHSRACDVCRAELARELGLDRLLERVEAPVAPAALARDVLAALAEARRAPQGTDGLERADEIDELIARVPAPRAPSGLARRVLSALEPARVPRRAPRRAWLVAAAAGLLAAVALWLSMRPGALEPEPGPTAEVEALEGDEELLLYAVERWELLNDEDLDVWLASLDPVDEMLMEFADDLAESSEASGGQR